MPFLVLSLLFLVGCDRASLMKRVTPPAAESAARNYVELLRENRIDEVEKQLDPSISTRNIRDTLGRMAAMFPDEEPKSVKVVGAWVFYGQGFTGTNITLEYEFSGRWLLANVVTAKRDGVVTITGFHVNPMATSLENLHRFTFAGKGTTQYTILFLAILSLVFSLYVLVICVKTRPLRRKWLWIIVILLGVGKLGVDWTNGRIFFTPLHLQLPPAGAGAPPYGAWIVFATLPVGALAFLLWKRRRSNSAQVGNAALQPDGDANPNT